jgi:apolipoprotein N-acyltransferase
MNGADAPRASGLFLSLLSGGLLSLAFPPADLGWLAFAALVPLLVVAARSRPRHAALYGLVCGTGFFTLLLYWVTTVMSRYGGLSIVVAASILALLVLYLAAYVALFAALVAAARARWGWRGLLLAPAFWVGLEILRGRLLTGFPWGLAGYSQWRNLALLQLSSLGGVYLTSFIVLLANSGLALLLLRPPARAHRTAGILLIALAAGAHAGGRAILPKEEAGAAGSAPASLPIRVAAIQANVAQGVKWRQGEEQRIVADLLAMSQEAAQGGAALVIWPESSSPLSFYRPAGAAAAAQGAGAAGEPAAVAIEPRREFLRQVEDSVRQGGYTLIAGSVGYHYEGESLRATNSAFVIGPSGAVGPSYDKVHLVPFGEYVPLRSVLFFVDRMVQGAIAEFAPGRRLRPLTTPAGEAATFVCYEAIFPELVRRLALSSDFLINITNDAWFGRSAAPRQHLAMAVFRAPENRRWLVRAANTGISALVDPGGRVVASTPLEVRTILAGRIARHSGRTLYACTGDVFAWACAIVTLLSGAALRAAIPRRALGGRAP